MSVRKSLCAVFAVMGMLLLVGCGSGGSSSDGEVIAGLLGPYNGSGSLTNTSGTNVGSFDLTFSLTGASGNGKHGVQGKLKTTGAFPGTTDIFGSLDDATGKITLHGTLPEAAGDINYEVVIDKNNNATVTATHAISNQVDTGSTHVAIK